MTGKAIAQRVQEARSRIDNLSPDQVAAEMATGAVTLVDVRDAPELAGGVIAERPPEAQYRMTRASGLSSGL